MNERMGRCLPSCDVCVERERDRVRGGTVTQGKGNAPAAEACRAALEGVSRLVLGRILVHTTTAWPWRNSRNRGWSRRGETHLDTRTVPGSPYVQ